MSDEEIGVYFSDPTYGQSYASEEEERAASAQFKRELEEEFGLPFDFTSIGTGAAEAAYFVKLVLDHWPYGLVVAAFFQGKRINENLDAWIAIAKKFEPLIKRANILNRTGSAVIAVNKLFGMIGKLPSMLQLKGYTRKSWWDRQQGQEDPGDLVAIDSPLARAERMTIHVFQIDVDDRHFRVFVEEKEVWAIELPTPTSSSEEA